MILPAILLISLLFVVVLVVLPRLPQFSRPYVAGIAPLIGLGGLLTYVLPEVREHGALSWSVDWFPSLGVNLDLTMNGWGLLMSVLVTGIGSLIMVYCFAYEKDTGKQRRLYGFLSLFLFAMVGLTMSDHLIIFFLFWELTSIVSYLLVGFYHEKAESRRNALQALLITGSGGMCLLAGFILLYIAGGSWLVTDLTASAEAIKAHSLYPSILTLIAIGAFTKSAQFPFHLWLPNAMVAPTPISAYLHSATMVKAGVFLLGLLFPVLGGTPLWTGLLCTAGVITLIVGGVFGLKQHDLKAILAGTTLAVLGLLVFLLGLGTEKALLALAIFITAHAMYKACLFMVAGAVDKATGTRDVRLLGGLRTLMPFTASVSLIAGLSKMGLPPFYGFIGKEYAYKALYPEGMEWLNWVIVLANAIILALAFKVAILPYFSKVKEEITLKKVDGLMYGVPALLAVLGLVLGVAPFLVTPLTETAVAGLTGTAAEVKVALWTGFNKALLMSGETVVIGVLLCAGLGLIYRFLNLPAFAVASPEKTYDLIHNSLIALARWATATLQNGSLHNYLSIIVCATLGLVVWKMSLLNSIPAVPQELPLNPIVITVSLLMLASVFVAVRSESKLTSIIALGVIGFGVALIFAVYSAPDLAITQILVETLTVVVFAWVIKRIGSFAEYSSRLTRWKDGILAVSSGVIITLLVLKSKSLQLSNPISNELTEMSYPDGKGANVVNVILVDFRALDTLGEITVLTIAALGVWALLSTVKKPSSEKE